MFKIEYEERGVKRQPIITQDCKDVVQILINIANDEAAEREAYEWCCNAHWGDNFVNQKYKFTIQCIYDEKHILKPDTPGGKLNKNNNPFMNEENLQKIADIISSKTGYANEFIGYDNDSLTWDFSYGVSYMKNNQGKGLYFALNDDTGKELTDILDTDVHRFIERVISAFKTYAKPEKLKSNNKMQHSLRNEVIIQKLKYAAIANKEEHFRVYSDGCWWIDIERYPNGLIRFWVGFEDKRNGNSNQSLCTIYKQNGITRYSCEIKLKQSVEKKIISMFNELNKNHLIRE